MALSREPRAGEIKPDVAPESLQHVEILKRLIPGDYDTMTGHPDAHERARMFVEDVTSRIPELKRMKSWEIEDAVISAVEWAASNLCRFIKGRDFVSPTGDYAESVVVYKCHHDDIGHFYLLIYEAQDASSGFGYFRFILTRDRNEILKAYRDIKESMEEEERRAYGEEEE
jgi:hypothetical protein